MRKLQLEAENINWVTYKSLTHHRMTSIRLMIHLQSVQREKEKLTLHSLFGYS